MRKKLTAMVLALVLALSLVPTALASDGIAKASTQSVEVDGTPVEFQMYALESAEGLTNYVKLRDVAHVLNSTPAKFSVGYDGTISITTGEAYSDNGSEMTTPYSGDRAYKPGPGAVKVNGADVSLDAIVLTDDSGGAYTYFKLRDLGTALGFKVDWTGERGVFIETGAAPVNSGEVTLADLQGVWHQVSVPDGWTPTEADIIISGDQYTKAIIQPNRRGEDDFFLFQGTISELKKNFPYRQANSICAYAVLWSGTEQYFPSNGVKTRAEPVEGDAVALKIIELDLEKGYFVDLERRRYEIANEPTVKNKITAAVEAREAKRAEMGSAYNFLDKYVQENGYENSMTNQHAVHFLNTMKNKNWTFSLIRDDSTGELFLRAYHFLSDRGDSLNFLSSATYDLTLTPDGGPYQGRYDDFSSLEHRKSGYYSGDGDAGTFTIDPGTFSIDTERLDISGDADDFAETNGKILVNNLLVYLERDILSPNGYTLADLGFTNY